MGKGSLHAVLLLGRMRKAIARMKERQLSWRKQLAALSGNQHCPPGRSSVLLLQTTHSLCTCKAKVGMIQTYISVNEITTQRRSIMSFIVCFTEENRGLVAPRDTSFFSFFLSFSFDFHCHFSSVERGRHAGSSIMFSLLPRIKLPFSN